MQKAVVHHQEGRLHEAEQSYLEILGYQQSHEDALRFLGGLYIQSNRPDLAIGYLEKALSLNPTHLELLNNMGVVLYRLGKPEEAALRYQEALRIKPDYMEALLNLGNLLRDIGKSDQASAIYERIVLLKPDDFKAWLNLGTISHDRGELLTAMAHYEKALTLKPGSPDVLINRGSLLMELDRPDEAEKSYQNALNIDPLSSEAKWGKALSLLTIGDYEAGWKLYESGFQQKNIRGKRLYREAFWHGHVFEGKRLLIWGEQGLGDEIQFIRYAALCKERGGQVLVRTRAPLVRLFWNCPFIDDVRDSFEREDFDYHIPVMSLPHVFGTTLKTIPAQIPYLYVSEEARKKWMPLFKDKEDFKIGLVWAGNPRIKQIDASVTNRRRSMGFPHFNSLLAFEGCHFYSLQKGEATSQLSEREIGEKLTDYTSQIEDFMDTAALIENLDLIISVDTSVAHLAGALGKPVWILSRFAGCWRWLRNQKLSPWYPTARIFGQKNVNDWGDVMEDVSRALRVELSKKH